jgi:tetratricopeptide (TPR) repeat protein
LADDGNHHDDMTLDQLGTVHFPVSCKPESQKTFEKGVALLHSFWYEESKKTFTELATQDPNCAMAYWGVAMSDWHQLWDHPDAATIKSASEELRKADKLAQNKTAVSDRERGYLAAIDAFYANSEKMDHETRARAYSSAMERVYQKYPDDHEASAFYALSLLASEPDNDTTFDNRKQAGAILQKLFDIEPNHPGIAHYLIHAYDKPQLAELGLPAARRYAAIAPSAPHAVHMPSHIFARVGDWQDSIKSNLASIALTRKATEMNMGGGGHQFHAMDYLIYAYLQIGREADAWKMIEEVKTMPAMHMASHGNDTQAFGMSKFPAMYALELHRWSDAAALLLIADATPEDRAYTLWAKTIGSVRSGNVAEAKKDLAEIAAIKKDAIAKKKSYISDEAEMYENEAAAWILHGEGKNDEATAAMRKAADHEDAVGEEQTSMPAREMLADMLMEMKRPEQALAEYQAALKLNPKRFDGLYGAGQAAEASGQASRASEFYASLVKDCEGAGSQRPELARAKQSIVAEK